MQTRCPCVTLAIYHKDLWVSTYYTWGTMKYYHGSHYKKILKIHSQWGQIYHFWLRLSDGLSKLPLGVFKQKTSSAFIWTLVQCSLACPLCWYSFSVPFHTTPTLRCIVEIIAGKHAGVTWLLADQRLNYLWASNTSLTMTCPLFPPLSLILTSPAHSPWYFFPHRMLCPGLISWEREAPSQDY